MILPYLGRAFTNLFRKPATEKFPLEDAPKAQPNYRGRIAYDPNLCINCGLCSRVCAPQAITRTIKPLPNGDSEITLTFDMTSCTFCGTCADFCVKHAIKMTDDYMIVGTKPEDFLVSGTFIKKKPAPPKFRERSRRAMQQRQHLHLLKRQNLQHRPTNRLKLRRRNRSQHRRIRRSNPICRIQKLFPLQRIRFIRPRRK